MDAKPGYLSEVFVSFQGEGAYVGCRHLFVRLAGCNLRCRYCDTPDSLERTAAYTVTRTGSSPTMHANPVSATALCDLIAEMLASEGPIDAVALTGGEPLTQSEFLASVLGRSRLPVPVLLETNGVLPGRLRDVLALVDIVSMDIKPPSNTGEGAFWREHEEFLDLARTRQLYVKILVDDATTPEDVDRAAALLGCYAPHAPLFLQPIVSPTGELTIESGRLAGLYSAARSRHPAVRVLPQIHKVLGIP